LISKFCQSFFIAHRATGDLKTLARQVIPLTLGYQTALLARPVMVISETRKQPPVNKSRAAINLKSLLLCGQILLTTGNFTCSNKGTLAYPAVTGVMG